VTKTEAAALVWLLANRASVGSATVDPNAANNTAIQTVIVQGGG